MKGRRICILMCVLLLAVQGTWAQEQKEIDGGHWSLEAGANYGYLLHGGPYNKVLLHGYDTYNYDLRLQWQALPSDSSAYDEAFGRPKVQVGLQYGDFSQVDIYRPTSEKISKIEQIITLYGGMQVDLWRSGRFALYADVEHGAAFCAHPFHEQKNPDNDVIGSHLNIYVGFGLHGRYRLSPQWSLTAGFDMKHVSNGTLDRPNLGANSIGPSIGLRYDLQPRPMEPEPKVDVEAPSHLRGFYLDCVAGMGMKALIDRFAVYHSRHNPIHTYPTFMLAPMWRWNLLHATGIGIDYTHAKYVDKIREYDALLKHPEADYSHHLWGLALRHEVFYKRMSANVCVGVYLQKQTGYTATQEESRTYQNVGLRYTLPWGDDRLFLGYNVKAHKFSKVDCVQLLAGIRLF